MDLDVRRRARGQQEPGDPEDADGYLTEPTALVGDAHAAGLVVHIWTIRDENQFLPKDFWIGTDPNAKGDSISEIHAFLDAGGRCPCRPTGHRRVRARHLARGADAQRELTSSTSPS